MEKRLAIVSRALANPSASASAYLTVRMRVSAYFSTAMIGGSLDKVFLLSGKATKTTINSQVRQHVKALTAADSLYIFYVLCRARLLEERAQFHHLLRHRP